MNKEIKDKYLSILKKELIYALGCTEPAAIAYVSATAKEYFNEEIKKVKITCSVNIIKNVNGVIIPNTAGKKGIKYAIASGIISNKSYKKLNILETICKADILNIYNFVESTEIQIVKADVDNKIYIKIELFGKNERVMVELIDNHTDINKIIKNNKIIYQKIIKSVNDDNKYNMDFFEIIDFVNSISSKEIPNCITDQIKYNLAIGMWGINNPNKLSLNVAKYYKQYSDSIAIAVAASESRMSGCSYPVIINSGSGNQGIVSSIPIIEYAKKNKIDTDLLYKALMLCNLLSIWQKQYFSKLSSFCGVVNAAASVSGALTWLQKGDLVQIQNAMKNTLCALSGLYCDGAKVSCALKVGTSLSQALLSTNMALENKTLKAGEGIVKKNLESTLKTISNIVNNSSNVDQLILKAMLEN